MDTMVEVQGAIPAKPQRRSRIMGAGLLLLALGSILMMFSSQSDLPIARTTVSRILADSNSTCENSASSSAFATYVELIPTTAGLRGCLANNINSVVSSLTTTCSVSQLTTLFSTSSTDSNMTAFSDLFSLLLSGLESSSSGSTSSSDLAAQLTAWSSNSTQLNGFCNIMNANVAPCVQALLPTILSAVQNDTTCCADLHEYVGLAQLIVPDGQTLLQTVYDLINGLHRSMCTMVGSSTRCGQSLFGYLAGVVSSDDSLLFSLLFKGGLPLYAISDSAVCSSLETTSITSRLASSSSIAYYAADCCASGFSTLMEAVDAMITHLSGNSLPEILTLMTASAQQFKAQYSGIQGCSYSKTCTDPSFLLPTSSAAPTTSSAAVAAKTATAKNVTCTRVSVCDTDDVCSSVCSEGTVEIAPSNARALTYQRNLTYAHSLCYAELPATHNSATTLARGYGNRDQLFNKVFNASEPNTYMRTNNQFLTVTDQLNIGARFIELDVHYFAGTLRSGHCSKISSSILTDLAGALESEVKTLVDGSSSSSSNSSVEWNSALMGCLPSLSGIRSELMRLHNETLSEVTTWVKNNPNDLIVLYSEIGTELYTYSKLDALLELFTTYFGDLVFTPSDLETMGGSWSNFTLSDLIAKGKRVILVATPEANDQMFYMRSLCDGWADVPSSRVSTDGTFWGQTMNAGSIVRAFSSALHYGTMSESGLGGDTTTGTAAQPSEVDASTLPVFVDAGVNILAPDGLDGTTMAAMIWSWASREPTTGDSVAAISATDGRWYGSTSTSGISFVACVSSSNRTSWSVVSQGSSCPSGYAKDAPKLAIENTALWAVVKAAGSDASAQLDVDLSNFPTVSTAEEDAFEQALMASGTTSSGSSGSSSSKPTSTSDAVSFVRSRNSLLLSVLLLLWIAL